MPVEKIGIISFGISFVNGSNLVPFPAAVITTLGHKNPLFVLSLSF